MQTTEAPRDNPAAPDLRPLLTTEQLAAQLGIRAQSIRQEYCRSGEYYGLRPKKLPNRFLRWPADSLEQLLKAAE
jgi:hypothetical protein